MQADRTVESQPSSKNGDAGLFVRGKEVARLRLLFLAPLAFAILFIVMMLVFTLYRHGHQSVQQGVIRIRASAQDFYEDSIRYDASALQAVMDTLKRDQVLQTALSNRNRQQLLARSATLFDELKKDFSISHLYFSDPERINLLRAHSPNRFGDRIDRVTMLAAEKNGNTSFGVELGALGTFTLRLVTPWYDETTHRLIGYVEVGIEIDRVLQKLRDFFGVEVFVLIDKAHLDRKQWEDGTRALGRTPDWDRFPTVLLGGQSAQVVPPMLAERLASGDLGNSSSILEAAQGNGSYRMAFLPLQDAGGHNVAHMVLIADVSSEENAALNTVYVGSLSALIVGTLLLGFFYWQVGRIGRRIEGDTEALEQIATHDGLTGVFNRRTFDALLEAEIVRARRYSRPLSLLMIDIDHFKQVNDVHGHQAGDAILRALSKQLNDNARTIDRVCRYGGEEITVILPETDAAVELGERLRAVVEGTSFDTGTGQSISITVSIGAASFPADADSGQTLISVADAALYEAKHGGRNRVCGRGSASPSSHDLA